MNGPIDWSRLRLVRQQLGRVGKVGAPARRELIESLEAVTSMIEGLILPDVWRHEMEKTVLTAKPIGNRCISENGTGERCALAEGHTGAHSLWPQEYFITKRPV